ncbi:MAG: class I adenylate-forming enzyme family protein [Anaerolineaceae bacterium]
MLVHEFLENSARMHPDKTCLVIGGQSWTYQEIDRMANRLANAFITQGLKKGERVVLFLPNCLELVVSIFAALKAGGVFVVVNPSTKIQKLTYILVDSQAVLLVSSGREAHNLKAIPEIVPSIKSVILTTETDFPMAENGYVEFETLLLTFPDSRHSVQMIDLDLACLIYTSGSTGDPKGVMSDHSNIEFAANSIISYLENDETDVVLSALPLSFDYGLYQLLMVFKFGGRLVLEKNFVFPAAILKRLVEEEVTGFPGVPTLFSLLLQTDFSGYDLSRLRYITNTAAALPPSHILQIRERFPGVKLFSMYGLTETKRTLYLPPEQLDIRPASVGIAIPGTEVWIEGEDGGRLGAGETGELVVRGRHVMRGYWNAPEETARRFRPGKYPGERLCYSGDLFRMDDEGYFYFVARKDDIIKSRGEKISPVEVERVLYALPGVVEAAVIGIPDPVLGQALKVFIVSNNPDITEKTILAHCRSNLEDYMLPKQVEFRAELEKSPSGKIQKLGLK